jgi:hypothetical protein
MRKPTFSLLLLAACGLPSVPEPMKQLPTLAYTPTWNKDVQPLVEAHCAGCHTQGGIAPFSLETYAETKPQLGAIAAAVQSRTMPPWMPSADCMPIKNSRALTDEQIAIVLAWEQAGGPEGDPMAAPATVAAQSQGLTWVDETLTAATPYTPNGALTDDYRCFILPRSDTADRDIIGIDVEPDHRAMVHHVIAYTLDPSTAQSQDAADPGEGWTCFGGPGDGAQMLGGWVPGTSATSYPEGTGIPLPAAKVVVIQIHYNLTAASPQPDLTRLKLQFAKNPVEKKASWTAMANWSFDIPPNATGYTSSTSTTLWTAGHVWGVFPHMHTLGRRITVTKAGACLMDVPSWDFHWQQGFFFDKPQGEAFTYGQDVTLSCTWDNTTAHDVRWGEKTTDEMCLAFFYVTK